MKTQTETQLDALYESLQIRQQQLRTHKPLVVPPTEGSSEQEYIFNQFSPAREVTIPVALLRTGPQTPPQMARQIELQPPPKKEQPEPKKIITLPPKAVDVTATQTTRQKATEESEEIFSNRSPSVKNQHINSGRSQKVRPPINPQPAIADDEYQFTFPEQPATSPKSQEEQYSITLSTASLKNRPMRPAKAIAKDPEVPLQEVTFTPRPILPEALFRYRPNEHKLWVQILVLLCSGFQGLAYVLHLFFHAFTYAKFWFCMTVVFTLIVCSLNQLKILRLNYFIQKHVNLVNQLGFLVAYQLIVLQMFPFTFVDGEGIGMSTIMLFSIPCIVCEIVYMILQTSLNEKARVKRNVKEKEQELMTDEVMLKQLKLQEKEIVEPTTTAEPKKAGLFQRRPSTKSVQQPAAILPSPTQDLQDPVPAFLRECSRTILKNAQKEGIFRAAAAHDDVLKAKEELLKTGTLQNIAQRDVYLLCAAMKAFYGQMRPQLLPHAHAVEIIAAQKEPRKIQQVLNKLSYTQRENLFFLANFLGQVVLKEHQNKMNLPALCLVFAPNVISDFIPGDQDALLDVVSNVGVLHKLCQGILDTEELPDDRIVELVSRLLAHCVSVIKLSSMDDIANVLDKEPHSQMLVSAIDQIDAGMDLNTSPLDAPTTLAIIKYICQARPKPISIALAAELKQGASKGEDLTIIIEKAQNAPVLTEIFTRIKELRAAGVDQQRICRFFHPLLFQQVEPGQQQILEIITQTIPPGLQLPEPNVGLVVGLKTTPVSEGKSRKKKSVTESLKPEPKNNDESSDLEIAFVPQ